jgi:hypothetical protein
VILHRFIDDTNKKVGEFPLSEKRREHLEQQLKTREFTTSTIKVGLSYILRVEKTYARLESYHKAWLERRRIAKSVMDDLAQKCPLLKEILGEANYRSFYEHANLRIVTFETGPPDPNSDPRLYIQITVPPRYRGSSSQSTPKNNTRTTTKSSTVPKWNASYGKYVYTNTQTTTPPSTVPQKRKKGRPLPWKR